MTFHRVCEGVPWILTRKLLNLSIVFESSYQASLPKTEKIQESSLSWSATVKDLLIHCLQTRICTARVYSTNPFVWLGTLNEMQWVALFTGSLEQSDSIPKNNEANYMFALGKWPERVQFFKNRLSTGWNNWWLLPFLNTVLWNLSSSYFVTFTI